MPCIFSWRNFLICPARAMDLEDWDMLYLRSNVRAEGRNLIDGPEHMLCSMRSYRYIERKINELIFKHCLQIFKKFVARPVGLMDKVSASGAGDSRFESWAGHFVLFRHKMHGCPRSIQVHVNSCSTNLWLGLGSPSMRMFVWSGQSCLPVHD